MKVVMPMAGHGSRFAKIGVRVPKPLIDIRGRPMYSWAMDSLPLAIATELIFVCLREHLEDGSLEADIRSRYDKHSIHIVPLQHVTRGQAETVLAAREHIDNTQPLIIYNADTYSRSDLASSLTALPPSVDGLLSVFRAPGEQWSFARTDESGKVVETAEKVRISDWATTGLYYFARGRDFVRHAEAAITANDVTRGEFYVAPLYNRMIAEGADIRIDEATEVWVLGTPEDLANFEARYPR